MDIFVGHCWPQIWICSRVRSSKDQVPNQTWWTVQPDKRCSYTPKTKPQDINLFDVEKIQEFDDARAQGSKRIVNEPGAVANASIVEEYDLSMFDE